MSVKTKRASPALLASLAAHVRTPLYRNAYALMLSSAMSSGLGMVYWVVAARLYSAESVGLSSTAISTMMFLAGISQLNLTGASIRFIPTAGTSTWRFVGMVSTIVAVMAALVSAAFIAGIGFWAPHLGYLRATPAMAIWFAAATIAWCIFSLQDSVLTGLRQAAWVPLKNAAFALGKLILLFAFAGALAQWGIFASWTAAHTLCLAPANWLIFRRLIPTHAPAGTAQAELCTPSVVARYVAGDYLGALCWLAALSIPPLMVLELAGPAAAAYYYLSFTIVETLYNVGAHMGASLIVEGARDRAGLALYRQRALLQAARIVVPVVALLVPGAPLVLRLFGESFSAEGTQLLRLCALSAIPHMVTALYVSAARVQRRVGAVFAVLASLCATVLGLSAVLLRTMGLVGAGWAWLAGQTIVAAALLLSQARCFRTLRGQPPAALLDASRHRMRDLRCRREAARLAARLLPEIATPAGQGAAPWRMLGQVQAQDGVATCFAGAAGRPRAVVKLALDRWGAVSLERERAALAALAADERLGQWRRLLPVPLATGEIAGHAYEALPLLPGRDARHLLADPTARRQALAAAASAIGELHRATAAGVVIDTALLDRWVTRPVSAVTTAGCSARYAGALERLHGRLCGELAGRSLCAGWTHGDLWAGNLLATGNGREITGIIDWDRAQPTNLPQLDLAHLLLSTRMIVQRRELGEVVVAFLGGEVWLPQEQALIDESCAALGSAAVEPQALVLLCWLQQAASNLAQSARYAGHRIWLSRNIEAVLQCL
ncbi:MAG TPA: phosphotransferase [Anaerolineae bacterium]|nr:phosphotransferase [Anaerolineae bacterium]HOQ98675.1 phosphotransferase [Anaerolineae bacterium]HPL26664.1 phosphotransferase [Anaerolineae bacterium]